jgi:hypothetical protein
MVRRVLIYIYFGNKRWAVVEYGLVIYLPHLTFVLGNLRHYVAVANSICLLFKKTLTSFYLTAHHVDSMKAINSKQSYVMFVTKHD